MPSARTFFPLVAAVLLAGCPADDESAWLGGRLPSASGPWYLGIWKLEQICGGFGCQDASTNDRFQMIELSETQFVEYQRGAETRSVPVTYYERQCITGEVHVNLSAEGGPFWCLSGDGDYLEGFEDVPDGSHFAFRRCLTRDFCP